MAGSGALIERDIVSGEKAHTACVVSLVRSERRLTHSLSHSFFICSPQGFPFVT